MVTIYCFAASYGVALACELLQLLLARPFLRIVSLVFGAAGLLAHTIYIIVKPLSLATSLGSLVFLTWILAIFYLYGSFHHKRLAWGLFVLPFILGLILPGILFPPDPSDTSPGIWARLLELRGEHFWGAVHGFLLLAAAVGVCVGCVASIMYLVQVQRLRAKMAPRQGVKMLSLERIEAMNRRAVLLAFPFLTAGLLVGVALKLQHGGFFDDWDPKIVSGLGLWVVFAILLYLRYSVHVRGRQAALWTLFAFALMVMALVSSPHPFTQGDPP